MTARIFILLLFFSPTAFAQTNPFAFIDSVIRKDNYQLAFLDFEYPPAIQEIITKFQKATVDRKGWFEKYVSDHRGGGIVPYHANFGITREEYQKIIDLDKTPPVLVVKKTVPITVNRIVNRLSFRTTEQEIKFLETLMIDVKNEVLVFLNDTIPFSGAIDAPASTPFGEWHGYSWKKMSSNMKADDSFKMDSLVSKIIEVDFGRVKKDDKILMIVKYKNVDNGSVKADLDMACYLD